MISDIQRYAFETTGLLIARGFCSNDDLGAISSSLNLKSEEPQSLFIERHPTFYMKLMSDPWIMNCCSQFIGPWFRFDHELAVCQTRTAKPYLHGGNFGAQGTCFHHSIGKNSWNGQLTVGIALTQQETKTGGFSYIPGSQHYAHGQYGQKLDIWDEMVVWEPEVVRTPTLFPGDLYVFSEALVHGQKFWCEDHPRRTLYLKYVPGYMAWQDYEITKRYLKYATTETQRALLSRPFVRQGDFNESATFRGSIRRAMNSEPPGEELTQREIDT